MNSDSIWSKIWRVIYPIGIYTGITFLIGFGFMVILAASQIIQQMNTSESYNIAIVMEKTAQSYYGQLLLITLIAALATLPILLLFRRLDIKRSKFRKTYREFTKVAPATYIFLIILGITACIAGNNLISISGLAELFPGFGDIADVLYDNNIFLEIIAIVIIVPITEELIFRVLGFWRIREYKDFWWAAIVSSLLFAIYHGNVVQGIYAFIIGILLSYGYEYYKTMWAPIIIHIVANGTSLFMTETSILDDFYANSMLFYLLTIATILLTAASIYCINKYVNVTEIKSHEEVQQP